MRTTEDAGRGLFITLEGLDGVGKTTQLERLAAWLRARGRTVRVTEEPAGTPLGQALDRLVKEPLEPLDPRAEALLFVAARAQHVATVIRPALAAGEVVLCSRFSHSTLAYQAWGLGLDPAEVRAIDAFARAGLWPDLVLLFEIDRATLGERLAERGSTDVIEGRDAAFRRRVRDGFRELAAAEPGRVVRIAAAGSLDEVAAAVRRAVEERL